MSKKTVLTIECNDDQVSDGYHTLAELYDHRCILFVALLRSMPEISWRAKGHFDGSHFHDWFIAGMHLPTGSISYHLPQWMWSMLDNSGIETLTLAPEWDGHTPEDVVKRLTEFVKKQSKEFTAE